MALDPRVATAHAPGGDHVEVAVTLPVTNRFTYRVPPEMASRAVVGSRVLVRFGPRKITGVVVREQLRRAERRVLMHLAADAGDPVGGDEPVVLARWRGGGSSRWANADFCDNHAPPLSAASA